jgi:hypothetical protein
MHFCTHHYNYDYDHDYHHTSYIPRYKSHRIGPTFVGGTECISHHNMRQRERGSCASDTSYRRHAGKSDGLAITWMPRRPTLGALMPSWHPYIVL